MHKKSSWTIQSNGSPSILLILMEMSLCYKRFFSHGSAENTVIFTNRSVSLKRWWQILHIIYGHRLAKFASLLLCHYIGPLIRKCPRIVLFILDSKNALKGNSDGKFPKSFTSQLTFIQCLHSCFSPPSLFLNRSRFLH